MANTPPAPRLLTCPIADSATKPPGHHLPGGPLANAKNDDSDTGCTLPPASGSPTSPPRQTNQPPSINPNMTNNDEKLWKTVASGILPAGTTAADLANCRGHGNYFALHIAAHKDILPPDTTPEDLANCRDHTNTSALHIAAFSGYIPDNITVDRLKRGHNKEDDTPWDEMIRSFNSFPHYALRTPPSLFKDHQHLAVQWSTAAIHKDPTLSNKAAIWLGNVLANNQP